MWEKNKRTIKCDKNMVTCDVGTTQISMWRLNCQMWVKIKTPLNVRKIWSNKILVLLNVTMEPSNVRKKKRELPNMTIVQSHVILVLHNLRMKLSNVRKKYKYNRMWQKYGQMWCLYCPMEPSKYHRVRSNVMLVLLNMTMELSNVRKNKETIECDKSTITYDISTAQCEDDIIKYEKK